MDKHDQLPLLTIIPAGAGSGKTYRIQKTLTGWIQDKKISPEKIVAVTFTEAAASELRERIRSELVKAGMLDMALKLDQAYISTIHGFGLRLITEFAFDAATSPSPRLLNDDEQGLLAARALAHSSAANQIMSNLERYGYRGSFGDNNSTAEDAFRNRMLLFIATLRSIGKDTGADTLLTGVAQQIRNLYGDTRLAELLKDELLRTVRALLKAFPHDISSTCDVSENIEQELKGNFADLKRAEKTTYLDSDWKLWKKLANLKTYKRCSKLPEGYDELASEVIAAAQELPKHPGPLADALIHAELLLLAANESLESYRREKAQRGLLDFTDMLATARQLLATSPPTLAALRERVDCLVIDEFQDTNPLQFSLLWSLTRQGVPTIIVGDLKQAIMGFQNADSRLLQELCNQNPSAVSPLTENWRSAHSLMQWINAMGAGLFGNGYTILKPMAEFTSRLSPLEVIYIPESVKPAPLASHVAARIQELLDDETQHVYDKTTASHRGIKGGDIAIICPTHARLAYYAQQLRAAGISCRLQEQGWSTTPIVRLACTALEYLADPDDLHAALYLAVTELGSHSLESALSELVSGRPLADPDTLDKLNPLTAQMADRFPGDVLAAAINALDLYGVIANWPDAEQARANLLRLQEECLEFEQANREALACGGYYGGGVKSFLAWLRGKIERDNMQPDPSVLDENTVQLTTWHSSKGKEWPVVAICGMDLDYSPRLPCSRVLYEDFSDLGAILDKVRVEICPNFDAEETKNNFLAELADGAEESAVRLLYVALTRTREKLILEWPGHLDSKKANKNKSQAPEAKQYKYWRLFVEKTKASFSGTTMKLGGTEFKCRVKTASQEPWEAGTQSEATLLSPIGRRAILSAELPRSLTPEHQTPSSLHGGQETIPEYKNLRYSEPLLVMPDLPAAQRGTLLHRCFEILTHKPELHNQLRTALEEKISSAEFITITETINSFRSFIQKHCSPVSLQSEVPFVSLDDAGTVITGTIDLLIETEDCFWIVDHKSDRIDEAELPARTAWYYPQLQAYREAVSRFYPDKTVKGIVINWVGLGMVTIIPKIVYDRSCLTTPL